MKVKAYECDKCGAIHKEDKIQGFLASQDMFDVLKSFPICPDADKSDFHYCMDCARAYVLNPTEAASNRAKDENARNQLLASLFYNFKKSIIFEAERRKAKRK